MAVTGRFYITTAIPYVNGRPHLGHALELVQADVLARHRRQRGDAVRFLSGTDDNALKNVHGAEAAGVGVAEFVDAQRGAGSPRCASRCGCRSTTSSGPAPIRATGAGRRAAVAACAARGDLYRRHYEGLYCVGCEHFYDAGRTRPRTLCAEHRTAPRAGRGGELVLPALPLPDRSSTSIDSGRLRDRAGQRRRNEVLAFLAGRARRLQRLPRRRAGPRLGDPGAGRPRPGHLRVVGRARRTTSPRLGYGDDGAGYRRWWAGAGRAGARHRQGHLRFHAVYWPAMLLSAGCRCPTPSSCTTTSPSDGAKIARAPATPSTRPRSADRYGVDALRWWLLREVAARRRHRLHRGPAGGARERDLANGLGNLQPHPHAGPPLPRRPDRRPADAATPVTELVGACQAPPLSTSPRTIRLPSRHRRRLLGGRRG